MKFKNRIRGYAELQGSRILPAPLNFRTHGEGQRDVLRGLLADIGIAGAVLVWVPDDEARASLSKVKPGDAAAFAKWLAGYDGDFQLYDGHLRAEEIRDQGIPALITDLNRTEAAEALGTYDAVSDLAGFDKGRFIALAGEFNSTNAAVQSLVAGLAGMQARMRDAASETFGGGGAGSSDDTASPDAGSNAQRPPREQDPDGREFDESIADDVAVIACPHCGKDFPAPTAGA